MIPRETTTRTAFCARCTPFWTLWERFWPFLEKIIFSKILKILTFPRTPPFDLPDFTPWFHLWFLQNRKFFKKFSEKFSKHFFSMNRLRPRGSLWGALHVEAIKRGGHRIGISHTKKLHVRGRATRKERSPGGGATPRNRQSRVLRTLHTVLDPLVTFLTISGKHIFFEKFENFDFSPYPPLGPPKFYNWNP